MRLICVEKTTLDVARYPVVPVTPSLRWISMSALKPLRSLKHWGDPPFERLKPLSVEGRRLEASLRDLA